MRIPGGAQALRGGMGVRLGRAGLVIHSPDGRCQVSPTRVGSRRCAAGRIRAAAQDDHASAVRQVPFRGHRAPAWRQSLPAVEERIDVARHGGSSECERRRVAGARPVGQRAIGADGFERSGPASVAVRGTSRQEPRRAARPAELSARVTAGPEQRTLELAADHGLDRRPGGFGSVHRVQEARPAGSGQAPPEARLGVVGLLRGRQLGAGRAEPLGDLDGGLPRDIGRGLRGIPFRLGGCQIGARGRRTSLGVGQRGSGRSHGALRLLDRRELLVALGPRLVVSGRPSRGLLRLPGRGGDPVALARPQLGHGLLRGEQGLVGRRELGDGGAPTLLGRAGTLERGRDLRDGLVIGVVELALRVGQLGRFALESRGQLPKSRLERLEPALGADDGLARRLARVAGLASRLLRCPVALLRGADGGTPRILRFAEGVERGLGAGGGAARLPERRASGLLATSV